MKLLVCGPRTMGWGHQDLVLETISALKPTLVIQGGAYGADTIGKSVAEGLGIQTVTYHADWKTYGSPRAGHIRNKQMLDEGKPDLVLAFRPKTGWTSGTANMVRQANEAGVEVKIVEFEG